MSHTEMLREVMKGTGWTQEQLAGKLGVSFATINSWLNGKTKPRESLHRSIEKLYLAQDLTGEGTPVYVTIVNTDKWLRVGDNLLLRKSEDNDYDDEAIEVQLANEGIVEFRDVEVGLSTDGTIYVGDKKQKNKLDDAAKEVPSNKNSQEDEECEIGIQCPVTYKERGMYVANSVSTVVRGTYSAGRIYDKLDGIARAQVLFIHNGSAIARIVDWNAKEK